jgi:hypothetical protein
MNNNNNNNKYNYSNGFGHLKIEENLEELGIDGKTVLMRILKKYSVIIFHGLRTQD